MSDERWRLFVAATVPQSAATALWDALAGVRARYPETRWMPAEQYHATLVFLGSTDPARVLDICAAIDRAAGATGGPFDVVTGEGTGRAGGRRGGVAWLRIDEGRDRMAELAYAVDREIGSGVYTAAAPPRPHVTVARRVDEALLADLRYTARDVRIPWRVERIVLFRSHTGPGGSMYEELVSTRL